MYRNAGNAAYRISTGFTRLDEVRMRFPHDAELAHFGCDPPTFFMNAMTSDVLYLPLESLPIVS